MQRRVSQFSLLSGGGSALARCRRRYAAFLTFALVLLPQLANAQSPWERAAGNLEQTFTGPLARSLARALGLEPYFVRTRWTTLLEDYRAG